MLEIDGSIGGGQLLRTGVALSALTETPFKIINIRKARKKSGLRYQHLEAVNAIAKLCDAEVKGLEIGSEEIEFTPKKLTEKKLEINIPTAGSVGLVLQALLITGVHGNLDITIKGGATYGSMAVPVSFLQNILIPFLSRMNYFVDIEVLKEGFCPKGGALVKIKTKKTELKKLEITEKGKLLSINGISIASISLKKAKVAERQADEAKKILSEKFKINPEIEIKYQDTLSTGSGIQLWAKTENSLIGGNSLGEIRKKSEIVGKEAANMLIWEYENGVIDRFAADQLLPYLALSSGKIKTSRITQHIKTNSIIIEKFLPIKFQITDNLIEIV
jgi:RNA 3'-terminal phosphate cyclase (ATP)/RNA 3'-terminal phosphate cyclase (GTP)